MKLSFICKLIANFFLIFVLISPSSGKCFPTTLIFPDPHQANSHQANSPFSQLQPGGSAGHRVAMLESLKAGLVGADYCLIVLFRVAVNQGLQQGCMGPQPWTQHRRNPTQQGLIDLLKQRSPQLCICRLNNGHQSGSTGVRSLSLSLQSLSCGQLFWLLIIYSVRVCVCEKQPADLISSLVHPLPFFPLCMLRLDDPSLALFFPLSLSLYLPSSTPPANPCYFHPTHIRRCTYPASDGCWLDS